ncbi:hypothetical protein SK128_027354 [Halocaridina rubra]|uniref:C2H2-type domain-containing protein n=1 Tax=Halocaridina rubra TaxID=373956 RepID=A0AAN8X6A5_HALRR
MTKTRLEKPRDWPDGGVLYGAHPQHRVIVLFPSRRWKFTSVSYLWKLCFSSTNEMSSKKITYSNDFKLKVLDYYFKHGGDDIFGLKKKTAIQFNIDKKTINRMLNNPDMVKRARKIISARKAASVKTSTSSARPPVKAAVKNAKPGGSSSKSSSSSKSASSSQNGTSSSSSSGGSNSKASTSSTSSTKTGVGGPKQLASSSANNTVKSSPPKSRPAGWEEKESPGVQIYELPEDPDYSLLKRSINASTNGVANLTKILVTGTEEVRNSILNECDVILECKVCRNLFRSVVNFLAHKRIYCQEEFADVRTMFHKGDVQGLTSQTNTLVVEPEPPPDGEPLSPLRTTVSSSHASLMKPGTQGKLKQSAIDSIALKLARKRKAFHASSSTNTGSSTYYHSLGEISRSRDKLSRDCSVVLEDIGGVTNAVFQSYVPPGSNSPSTSMSCLVDEASHTKGVTVAINQHGEIIKSAPGDISVMDVDESSSSIEARDLTCLLCNTRFATPKALSVHQRSHHGFERCIYSCPICHTSFLSMWKVVKHLQIIHKKNKNQVERLRKVVKKNVRKKISFHTADKNVLEADGGKGVTDSTEEGEDDDDEDEESNDSSSKTNEVTTCKRTDVSAALHVSAHKSDDMRRSPEHRCVKCERKFNTPAALSSHDKFCSLMQMIPPERSLNPLLRCETPEKKIAIEIRKDYKKPVTPFDMERSPQVIFKVPKTPQEQENQSKIEDLLSEFCNFSSPSCIPCGRKYTNIGSLKRHAATHIDWTRFVCSACHFRSYNRYEVIKHCMTVHNAKITVATGMVVEEEHVGPLNYFLDNEDNTPSLDNEQEHFEVPPMPLSCKASERVSYVSMSADQKSAENEGSLENITTKGKQEYLKNVEQPFDLDRKPSYHKSPDRNESKENDGVRVKIESPDYDNFLAVDEVNMKVEESTPISNEMNDMTLYPMDESSDSESPNKFSCSSNFNKNVHMSYVDHDSICKKDFEDSYEEKRFRNVNSNANVECANKEKINDPPKNKDTDCVPEGARNKSPEKVYTEDDVLKRERMNTLEKNMQIISCEMKMKYASESTMQPCISSKGSDNQRETTALAELSSDIEKVKDLRSKIVHLDRDESKSNALEGVWNSCVEMETSAFNIKYLTPEKVRGSSVQGISGSFLKESPNLDRLQSSDSEVLISKLEDKYRVSEEIKKQDFAAAKSPETVGIKNPGSAELKSPDLEDEESLHKAEIKSPGLKEMETSQLVDIKSPSSKGKEILHSVEIKNPDSEEIENFQQAKIKSPGSEEKGISCLADIKSPDPEENESLYIEDNRNSSFGRNEISIANEIKIISSNENKRSYSDTDTSNSKEIKSELVENNSKTFEVRESLEIQSSLPIHIESNNEKIVRTSAGVLSMASEKIRNSASQANTSNSVGTIKLDSRGDMGLQLDGNTCSGLQGIKCPTLKRVVCDHSEKMQPSCSEDTTVSVALGIKSLNVKRTKSSANEDVTPSSSHGAKTFVHGDVTLPDLVEHDCQSTCTREMRIDSQKMQVEESDTLISTHNNVVRRLDSNISEDEVLENKKRIIYIKEIRQEVELEKEGYGNKRELTLLKDENIKKKSDFPVTCLKLTEQKSNIKTFQNDVNTNQSEYIAMSNVDKRETENIDSLKSIEIANKLEEHLQPNENSYNVDKITERNGKELISRNISGNESVTQSSESVIATSSVCTNELFSSGYSLENLHEDGCTIIDNIDDADDGKIFSKIDGEISGCKYVNRIDHYRYEDMKRTQNPLIVCSFTNDVKPSIPKDDLSLEAKDFLGFPSTKDSVKLDRPLRIRRSAERDDFVYESKKAGVHKTYDIDSCNSSEIHLQDTIPKHEEKRSNLRRRHILLKSDSTPKKLNNDDKDDAHNSCNGGKSENVPSSQSVGFLSYGDSSGLERKKSKLVPERECSSDAIPSRGDANNALEPNVFENVTENPKLLTKKESFHSARFSPRLKIAAKVRPKKENKKADISISHTRSFANGQEQS